VNVSEEGVYHALCVKAGKKRRQCPQRSPEATRVFWKNDLFLGGAEGGKRKVLFFSVFQCIWRAAFSSMLFMNVFQMIVVPFGVATRVTTVPLFFLYLASCGNRRYTYSLLCCYTI
jgi:hypothetical protein